MDVVDKSLYSPGNHVYKIHITTQSYIHQMVLA